MRKKRRAQCYLEQVEKIDTVINNKIIEKAQIKQAALSITASTEGERVQSSGSQSRMADAIAKYVDMEAEIDSLVDRLYDKKQEIIRIIEQVENPIQYNLLHMKYIQFKDLHEIALRYGKEYNWATTTHGRALNSVEHILRKQKNL